MTRARTVLGVQVALAVLAGAVLTLGLFVALTGLSFGAPSAAALAAACGRFALPDASLASLFALMLGSVAVAVLALAIRSAFRQALASGRLLASLEVTGRGPARSVVFRAPGTQAFCAGLLRPRVYVSTGALRALGSDELGAVLAHESHHASMRDPLRMLVARALGDALFFLPGMRQLSQRYGALAELAADEAAVKTRGPQPLASALVAFERSDPAVVGIAPERVDHLLGMRPRWDIPIALIAWTVVLLTVVAVVALRLDAAMGQAALNVPLFAAQACMISMAVVPVVLGAGALLAGGRFLRLRS